MSSSYQRATSMWSACWHFLTRPFFDLIDIVTFATSGELDRDAVGRIEQEGYTIHPITPELAKPSARERTIDITYRYVQPGSTDNPEAKLGQVTYLLKGTFLAKGGTAILELLPSGNVMKTPTPNPFFPHREEYARQDVRFEAVIYAKIGEHPRIPKFIDYDVTTCCLTIEYLANGSLREYFKRNQETITLELRHKWAKQAAEGLQVLHSFDIVHCDISPRNFLLDHNLNLKISDFAGSSFRGSPPAVYPSTRFCHPSAEWEFGRPHNQDDIFGLGSLIYFIMTNEYPYEELCSDDVENLYSVSIFPDVSSISCGKIIEKCWLQRVEAVQVHEYFDNMDSNTWLVGCLRN